MSLATLAPMLDILRLRGGPQNLPSDHGVLVFWMGASIVSGILVAAPLHGFPASVFLSALDLALLYLFVLTVLGLQGLTGRWLQTYTAMVGVSALLGLVMSGLLWLFPPDFEAEQVSPAGMVAYLALVVWLLLVFGHILQQALNLGSRMTGVAIALGFLILSSVVTQFALGIASA
ncbi:hypothetical protein [Thioalkalivibrio paradoxus]|uniref:Yip1 domain-containing protein n=1 Tax=Thioalkalivibrio paradoxus ARh 1 TaxID=713585 RepID=W0DQ02_9GAMM|nr:hypothetical protein THITH_14725 [Thioalkalivibrio paradoxus ARh 1]